MRNTVKSQTDGHASISDGVVYYNSDRYFNDPDSYSLYEDLGFDIQPVDVFGGFVPQDKSLGNLQKNQRAIRTRFSLGE